MEGTVLFGKISIAMIQYGICEMYSQTGRQHGGCTQFSLSIIPYNMLRVGIAASDPA